MNAKTSNQQASPKGPKTEINLPPKDFLGDAVKQIEENWSVSKTVVTIYRGYMDQMKYVDATVSRQIFELLNDRQKLTAWQFACVASAITEDASWRGFSSGVKKARA